MFASPRSLILTFVTLGSIGLGAAACTGGGGGGGGTPTPTPYNPDLCVIDWIGDAGNGEAHIMRVLMNAPQWGGQGDYSDTANVGGLSAYRLPGTATSLLQARVVAEPDQGTFETAGTAGVEAGDVVALDDTTPNRFMQLNSAGNPTGVTLSSAGVGSFDGEWSPPADPGDFLPDPDTIVTGSGSITIPGTSGTVTVTGTTFGWCVKDLQFAPNLREQILLAPPAYRPQ